jgi:hypothetical protein
MKAEQLTPEQVLHVAYLAVAEWIPPDLSPDKNSGDEFAQVAAWLLEWLDHPPDFARNGNGKVRKLKKVRKVRPVVNRSLF